MWCRNCNIETNEKNCPICGQFTEEDTPVEIMWCGECNVPIIRSVNDAAREICPICGRKTRHLSADLRPVFPEERLLLELLLDKKPNEFAGKSVWASNSRYYIDGKSVALSASTFQTADTDMLAEKLSQYSSDNSYEYFNEIIDRFVLANKDRLFLLKEEAFAFVRHAAAQFDEERIVISFSGGKDSTATADVVVKALSNPSLVHIFGDTTLEFPSTIEYAHRFRENHPQAIFEIARNDEQVFYDVCEDIGPPARMMRWCCSTVSYTHLTLPTTSRV